MNNIISLSPELSLKALHLTWIGPNKLAHKVWDPFVVPLWSRVVGGVVFPHRFVVQSSG